MGPVIWSCAGAALEGQRCGTELGWSGAWRAAACGKPTWNWLRKDSIHGRHHREVIELDHYGLTATLFPCAAYREEVKEGEWKESAFSSHCSSPLSIYS